MAAQSNELKYDIDYELIDQKYQIVRISSSKKMKPSLLFLDSVLEEDSVLSVCYTDLNEVFVLLDSNSKAQYSLRKAISEANDSLSFSKVGLREIQACYLIQLFMNSLSRSTLSLFSYNNLSGHLYIIADPEKTKGKQIKTLEIKIDKECCLQSNVRTFTSKTLEKKIEFKKGKTFESYPQYVLANNKHLKRVAKSEKNSYILRQIRNKKEEMKFLDFGSLEKFDRSKCGIIQNTMEQFSDRYGKIIKLEFSEIVNPTTIEHKSSMTKQEKAKLKCLFRETPVRIIDFVNNELSAELSEMLIDVFALDGINIKQGKYLKKDCYNICIIHEKEKYEEGEDPHDKIEQAGPNQCITIETYMEIVGNKNVADSLKAIKDNVIQELLIKDDIRAGRISTYDWAGNNYEGSWKFIERIEENKETRYCCMTVKPDGSFVFDNYEGNLLDMNEFSKYEEAFQLNKNTVGVIEDPRGNVNCIIDTNMFTVPNLAGIKEELTKGNNKLKNQEMREELLTSVLDVNFYKDNEDIYYYVGIAQDKLVYSSNNAILIRKIESVPGSDLVFDKLLPLMNVMFVRNGQLTVIPFPYKYIREYYMMRFETIPYIS